MDCSTQTLDDILREYSIIELDFEIKIKEVLDKIQINFANINKCDDESLIDYSIWEKENNEALIKNKCFLQDLEQMKAKLRSRHCYQPASDNLHHQMKRYRNYIARKHKLKN